MVFGFGKSKPKTFLGEPIQMCPQELENLYKRAQELQAQLAQNYVAQEGPKSAHHVPQSMSIPIDYNWTPQVHQHYQQQPQPQNYCNYGYYGNYGY